MGRKLLTAIGIYPFAMGVFLPVGVKCVLLSGKGRACLAVSP